MGGCRCTYKNCCLRSDKVTHMFHYPVFDKVRCHQWLTNARKLEFLDLKVSQLKNRVVCQHHFKDDYFMNFMKDKLTFDAVPTLDGPYCDTNEIPENNSLKCETKQYNIALEDIENEYLTYIEKKENFSVKYADFLTNGDLMDFDLDNQTDNRQLLKEDNGNQFIENNISVSDSAKTKIINQALNNNNNFNLDTQSKNVYTIELTEVPIEIQNNLPVINVNVPMPPITETTKRKANIKPKDYAYKSKSLQDKKIIIIDEQNISDKFPKPLPLKLEPVNPSTIISLPNKKRHRSYLLENEKNKNNASNRVEINNIVILGKDKKHKDYVKNDAVENEIVNIDLDCNNMQQVNISMSQFSNNVINDSNFVTTNNVINDSNVMTTNNVITDSNVMTTNNVINDSNVMTTNNVINDSNVMTTNKVINDSNVMTTNNVINDSNVITTNIVFNDSNVVTTNNVINDINAMTINNVINDSNVVTTNSVIEDSNVATTNNVINPGNYMNTGNYINVGDVINTANIVTTNIINNSNIISDAVIDTSSVNTKKNYTRSVNKSKHAKDLVNPNSLLKSNSLLKNNSCINKSDVNNTKDENTRSAASPNKKNIPVKNKIPPERIAAIQEKRKFNMKLRDIIADCLDKLDDNDSSNHSNSKLQTQQEQLSQQVGSYLAKAPELPNMPEYTVAYLEARIDKMEKLLLKKIDNNSQRILDLKNTLAPTTVNNKTMSTHSTQTSLNEEERKKQLFKEISQYLSTEANSLVYEELFIDKFVPKRAKYSLRKRLK